MALDLFAGIHVSDYEDARSWYKRDADANEIGFGSVPAQAS
jgi:hypothetical protein